MEARTTLVRITGRCRKSTYTARNVRSSYRDAVRFLWAFDSPVTLVDRYVCVAICQANGAPGGAYYVTATSSRNCGDATRNAKSSVPLGQYPRHCSCSDSDGFRGTGTQCENHPR